jgi:hypothetical protein
MESIELDSYYKENPRNCESCEVNPVFEWVVIRVSIFEFGSTIQPQTSMAAASTMVTTLDCSYTTLLNLLNFPITHNSESFLLTSPLQHPLPFQTRCLTRRCGAY